ncbi:MULTISPECIES: IS3 family transposase [Microbulbifer]|uniref:IS3 family transposase n=1 Tax=Microbulbifer TaxID=48073 RepID=UPI001E545D65|nr:MULTISPECIES: IS3 family transposase [Microbulbifer]
MDDSSHTPSKRTQRDYTLGFKLAVVNEVEKGDLTYKQAQAKYGIQGRSTVLVWLRKHGKLDWTQARSSPMSKQSETPAQTIKRLERQLKDAEDRQYLMEKMMEIIDQEYGGSLRKKYLFRVARQAQAQKVVPLARSCRLYGISPQAIYQRLQRHARRQQTLAPVEDWVREVRRRLPRLGTRKLYYLLEPRLQASGIKLGRDGLFDFLRERRLLIQPKRRYTKTTDSRHWLKKHPNLLAGMSVKRAEQVFVSDITYVESDEGVHYLSLVTDAGSRKIMGYELSHQMRAEDTVKALQRAVKARCASGSLIHHSDRGVQYCSGLYQRELSKSGIRPSMTDGYDCYQNALAERVNGILKQEFLTVRCRTYAELKALLKESIYAYNHLRPHLSLGMQTPESVRKKASSITELA